MGSRMRSAKPSRATVRRTIAFRSVRIPHTHYNIKSPTAKAVELFIAEDEGFDLHFLPGGEKILVLSPSSRGQADVHRTSALGSVRISRTHYNIKSPTVGTVELFMAEDEGFEPPQTESESGVLPLHKSSMDVLIICTI